MGTMDAIVSAQVPGALRIRRSPPDRAPRIILYSHDTLGFGHLRRNMLLASALKDCGQNPDILLIAGMYEAVAFSMPEGVDCVNLPAYAKAVDGSYRSRELSIGVDTLRDLRAATIRAAVAKFQPDLMIVDNVPRGAQFELDPTLRALRRSGKTRIVLGLRDIIDRPAVMRQQWLRQRNFEALREYYDDIWVYGDPALYDTATEYGLGAELSAKLTYTGYLDQAERLGSVAAPKFRRSLIDDDPRPYVLCTVGGGRDGVALAECFVKTPLPEGQRGILITGTQMASEARRRIMDQAAGRADMTVIDFVQEPVDLVAEAAAFIAMCGYNTACEIMSLDVRALLVPRVQPRAEQRIRAEKLSELGLADMLHPDALSPAVLGRWIAEPAPRRRPRPRIDLQGLERVKALGASLLAPQQTSRHAI